MAAAMGVEQWYKAMHDAKSDKDKPEAPPSTAAQPTRRSTRQARGASKRAGSSASVTKPAPKKRRTTSG
jgi:hypothetical protein